MIKLKSLYKKIKESNTTGGGVAGSTFTPGVGEQYSTKYAFGKNRKKKSYEVNGYKSFNPKVRFKAKTFDVANWASNSPKYLKELKLIPFSNHPENIKKTSTQLINKSTGIIQNYQDILLKTSLKNILYDEDQLKGYEIYLNSFFKDFDYLRKKVQDIADEHTDKGDWQNYDEFMDIDNRLVEQRDKIESLIFILELFDDLRNNFDESYHKI